MMLSIHLRVLGFTRDCVLRAGIVAVDITFGAADRVLAIVPLSGPARRLLRAARDLLSSSPLRVPANAVPDRDAHASARATLNDVDADSQRLRRVERQRDVLLLVLAHAVGDMHDDGEDTDSNDPDTPTSESSAPDPAPCERRVCWADELDGPLILDGAEGTSKAPVLPPRLNMSKQQWLPPPSHIALPTVDRSIAQDDRISAVYATPPALLDMFRQ